MTLSHSIATPRPTPPARLAAGLERAARGRRRVSAAVPIYLAVETPAASSILAIEPLSGSKSWSLTFDQPTTLAMVNRPDGVGNFDRLAARTLLSTGR